MIVTVLGWVIIVGYRSSTYSSGCTKEEVVIVVVEEVVAVVVVVVALSSSGSRNISKSRGKCDVSSNNGISIIEVAVEVSAMALPDLSPDPKTLF